MRAPQSPWPLVCTTSRRRLSRGAPQLSLRFLFIIWRVIEHVQVTLERVEDKFGSTAQPVRHLVSFTLQLTCRLHRALSTWAIGLIAESMPPLRICSSAGNASTWDGISASLQCRFLGVVFCQECQRPIHRACGTAPSVVMAAHLLYFRISVSWSQPTPSSMLVLAQFCGQSFAPQTSMEKFRQLASSDDGKVCGCVFC